MTLGAARDIAIIGAGPAGLMAADILSAAGHRITIYERMPSPARKLLMAGRGGLNLTHSEPLDAFLARYREARGRLEPAIRAFPPDALRAFAESLGETTFVGSSGRVFPRALKSSPLLRAWLRRLAGQGVTLHTGHAWRGPGPTGGHLIADRSGTVGEIHPDAVLLALGGASWPRLGSDGHWSATLAAAGVDVVPFAASNAGVLVAWSAHLRERHAGAPLKRIALSLGGERVRGEAVVTRAGLEGGAVYALSSPLRQALTGRPAASPVTLALDLRPDMDEAEIARRLAAPRGKLSFATFLKRALKLQPVDVALLHEARPSGLPRGAEALAALVKALPITISGIAGLDRAISSTGGIARDAVDDRFMLRAWPGVFAAGEMINWDAPTGGYLLQATFATAVAAAHGISAWLVERDGRTDALLAAMDGGPAA